MPYFAKISLKLACGKKNNKQTYSICKNKSNTCTLISRYNFIYYTGILGNYCQRVGLNRTL